MSKRKLFGENNRFSVLVITRDVLNRKEVVGSYTHYRVMEETKGDGLWALCWSQERADTICRLLNEKGGDAT